MSQQWSRRGFLQTGLGAFTGASVASSAATGSPTTPSATAPSVVAGKVHPAVVSSANGQPYLEHALAQLGEGIDTLDVVIAAVNNVERDPDDQSVGLGGLPNEDGVVELDSCCMHGPSNNAGAVASLRSIATPSSVAREVLWHTDHVLLVGEGALRFARARGFKEENLLTEKSRRDWQIWKSKLSRHDDWLEPHEKRPELAAADTERTPGTINFNACNAKGEVSGVTTTSGLSYKIPGRVGDSPIIGAGLYVDGRIGAAGSTGRGEAVIISCGAHTVVEAMRAGKHPTDACLHAIKRVAELNTMPYLVDEQSRPKFQVKFYAVDVTGRVGGAAIYPARYACGDARGARLADCAHLLEQRSE